LRAEHSEPLDMGKRAIESNELFGLNARVVAKLRELLR
jgi:hypothetical protein